MPTYRVGPRPVFAASGRTDPLAALAEAGGPPESAPEAPLLVVVNDPDRATDSATALRAIRSGAGDRPIRVLVATGSHRWSHDVQEEHEAPLREAVGDPCEFRWHDAYDRAHVELRGADGTAVHIDRWLSEAADVIAVGSVEPHWFAGLTGAHKTLTVGVMAIESISANHVHALDAGSRPLRLAGNPVHEGLERVVRALEETRTILALQQVVGRWLAGRPLACLAAAAPTAEARWLARVPRAFDFLVAVVAPPLSRTLYQAEKGVKNTENAVRDGGAIVLDAACEDGVGPSRFLDLLGRAPDSTSALDLLAREGYHLGDHKAVRLRMLHDRGVRLALVSSTFPEEAAHVAGFHVFRTREEAGRALRGAFGGSSLGAIVQDAGHMVVEPSS